ncbi:class I SAM-dependent methyltransferase [Streptomyces venezuelae]|uniref:class I SAM-dependent methyltransferase n=1 Tax=Streptomyces venezuelae TaxID=54571 RepID=UPI00278C6075|nr:class I SAM-dependent methyltransferase [Streptomyces venezuelae]
MEQYDIIGARYERSKTTAAFSAADTYTLDQAIGDVAGCRVLDVACGYGYNTRLLARRGARHAVGVDISHEMIRLARAEEERAPAGIEYHVADAAALPELGVFDLVTAVYLFNYAPSRAVLEAMFQRIRAALTDAGRLLAIVPNPAPFPHSNWDAYGSHILRRLPGAEVPLLRVEFLTDPPTPFEYHEWQPEDFTDAAEKAGFASVTLTPNQTPQPDRHRDEDFWRAYHNRPISSLITCTM